MVVVVVGVEERIVSYCSIVARRMARISSIDFVAMSEWD